MKISGKKLFASLLISLLVVGTMASCGNSSGGSGGSGGGGTKILFIMTDTNDTFRGTLSDAIVAAGKSQGVSLDMIETGDSVQDQLTAITEAKGKGYTVIILRSADANTAPQMNVASNDLPIIYVNAEPIKDHLEADKYIYVGSDELQSGQYQAEYVLKKLGNPKSRNANIFQG